MSTSFDAMQRAYDRREPDYSEDDAFWFWFASTSFVDMLPESTINDLLEGVWHGSLSQTNAALKEAVAAAWKKHQQDAAREAGELRAESLACDRGLAA